MRNGNVSVKTSGARESRAYKATSGHLDMRPGGYLLRKMQSTSTSDTESV
jgi:hypothetical protein